MVRRVYTEKRSGFEHEAKALLADLKQNLELEGLTALRVLNRYDVDGLDEETFSIACQQVFSEPAVDDCYIETAPEDLGLCFAVSYLPGQYDQRADSAAQCIQLITQQERPKVLSAKLYAFSGITKDDLTKIKQYLINPVESCEVSLEKPGSLDMLWEKPDDVRILDGFISLKPNALNAMHDELGLAMSKEDLTFVQEYFATKEKRNPSISEIRVIDTYWSDHCRHTTFLTEIAQGDISFSDAETKKSENEAVKLAAQEAFEQYLTVREEIYGKKSNRPITMMDMATIGAKAIKKSGWLDDLDQSEEINACSIKIDVKVNGRKRPYLLMFKNETHNHPTEIEPFGGAATCLGGAIRDPLSGRSYVYQAMRITGSADPREATEDTLPGKLPQRKITTGAAEGYSSYGNQIGLATGLVHEIYHSGYKAKRMEVGAVVGAAPEANVRREEPSAGDLVLLLGGRTGRDGIGGATGSSKAHTKESIELCGAEVQKGNPITERKLQRLYRNPKFCQCVKRCNDFGAGGVCVAIGELSPGLEIDLDAVPKKYEGLDGTEIAISESQERMAVVIAPEDFDKVMKLAQEENLECTPVAKITKKKRLVMTWRGKKIIDLSREFLDSNGVRQHAKVLIQAPDLDQSPFRKRTRASLKALQENLSDLNHCSQRGLGERFDSSIGAGTVFLPYGGRYQSTPAQAMAALIPVDKGESTTASLMSYGFDPKLSSWSPMHGAAYAVLHSVAKIVASGGEHLKTRLSFQEYFERLGEDAKRWGKPAAALLGALQAQLALKTPAIGGKDSMSGSFGDMDVPPTLISFAVSALDASRVVSNEFKGADHPVVLFPLQRNDADLPDYDMMRKQFARVEKLTQKGMVLSATAINSLAVDISINCFGNGLGFVLENLEFDCFAPMYGAIMMELPKGSETPEGAIYLGHTSAERIFAFGEVCYSLLELQKHWESPLESVFPSRIESNSSVVNAESKARRAKTPDIKLSKRPKAFIPVLPGTNCEYDTARALEKAGALAEVFVVKNASSEEIEKSVTAIARKIKSANMLILPGGFSGGDEPDGSAKFLTAILRAPQIQDAIMDLLNKRDGLILGICNGFQALVKLGLLPYGEIRPMKQDSPTLTYNEIGRHVSRIVPTRVCSVKSPWLRYCKLGEIYHVPVSHGEGRFVANEKMIEKLIKAGQVVMQYVDLDGNPTLDSDFNPNASCAAIEALCSPDGRILGKMGHSERIGPALYQNYDAEMDMHLFEAAVDYFTK